MNAAQFDDDWYSVEIDDPNATFYVNLSFAHADGNIDLEIFDAIGALAPVVSSVSTDDNESVSFQPSSAGTYFIKVTGDNRNVAYTLIWNSILDDGFEENDDFASAADIGTFESISQNAVRLNDDWFLITTSAGDVTLEIELNFLNSEGNLGFEIYDSSNVLQATVDTANDGESIIFGSNPSGDVYRIRVYGENNGTDYSIEWFSSSADIYEGEDSNNSFDNPTDLTGVEASYLSDGAGFATLEDED